MRLPCKLIDSPIGKLKLVASDLGLTAILWQDDNPRRVPLGDLREDSCHPILSQAEAELQEYFAGERKTFCVPLDLRGTPFQRSVWAALLDIPFGETRSYGQLALALGNVQAARAVGAANGRNPVAVMVPCHRVLGTSGKLTGFAGGLAAKEYLLTLESGERLFH